MRLVTIVGYFVKTLGHIGHKIGHSSQIALPVQEQVKEGKARLLSGCSFEQLA
jgi:hypothetical protein